ncbi:hypothetical protein PL71_15800 [Pseudoalteromonas distincta]|nr:hypothetical protein PL71_15800 [Pseudoalteromonas elyakovii]KID36415.1 hypothetical protein QT16_14065 [Pseudoalteromonas distincta]
MLTREAQLLITQSPIVKTAFLNASKLRVYKLNQTAVLNFVVGVELAHARSAASNYSTTYCKNCVFKR